MADEEEKPDEKPRSPSFTELAGVVSEIPRKIFTKEAVLWVLALLLGGVAFGQGMARLDGGVEKKLAPMEKHLEATDAQIEAMKRRQDQQDLIAEETSKRVTGIERLAMETNLNVRLMLESRGITPITVEPKDGGR